MSKFVVKGQFYSFGQNTGFWASNKDILDVKVVEINKAIQKKSKSQFKYEIWNHPPMLAYALRASLSVSD